MTTKPTRTTAARPADQAPAADHAAPDQATHRQLRMPNPGTAAAREYADLLDRIFDKLPQLWPQIAADQARLEQAKSDLRDEFGGQEAYVRSGRTEETARRDEQIRAMFNGRNAREVARVLGVGRTTVYRALKRPGRA